MIFAGYFNLICESWICGGSPFLKRHSFSEIIKLNETFNLRDIWRVCNRHKKLLKFRQKHFTGFIQRRLDYIFVSNRLQESVKKTETLNALSSDHSPIFCSFVNNDTFARVQVFGNSIILCCSILTLLTILTGKNCVLFNSVQNGWLAASDLFNMFTPPIKFYYTFYYHLLRIQMFKKCDSANRQ